MLRFPRQIRVVAVVLGKIPDIQTQGLGLRVFALVIESRIVSIMNAVALFFYLFAGITVAASVMVISSRNPVHSVLYLILAFVNASGLFLLMGAEFLAMILIVVYVGAVAVLFLFVVMMLDVDFAQLRQGFINYLPIGAVVGLIFLVELIMVVGTWTLKPEVLKTPAMLIPPADQVSNTLALGRVLYTDYIFFFQTAGLILLVAMIGAIVLTLRDREGVKRQDISRQVARTKETAMEIKTVASGQGLAE
jgi:NADH-quinone oxidoreductase subunit J